MSRWLLAMLVALAACLVAPGSPAQAAVPDSPAQFASDASFYRRAGLADSAGVSYESANYAGRYVRHYDYLLRVQTLSTATDRADATFHAQ
jgi:hypothetical protein